MSPLKIPGRRHARFRFLVLLGMLMAAAMAPRVTAHPQDGPHADVRIRLEDRTLRWHIGLNLAYMDEIVDVGRERLDAIVPIEEEILRDAVLEHLREDHRVVVDGRLVEPQVELWNLQRGDPTLLPLFPRSGMRGLIRAEIVLSYPHGGDPQHIEMTWPDFPLDVLSAELEGGDPSPLVLQAQMQAEGVIRLIEFSEGLPTVDWRREGLTIEQRLQPVPDLATAVADAGFRSTGMASPPRGGSAATDPGTEGSSVPPAPTRSILGAGLPLGGFLLAGLGVMVGMVSVMPRRPAASRRLGTALAVVLLGTGGWWTVEGPRVETGMGATAMSLAGGTGEAADAGTEPGTASVPIVTETACVAIFRPLLMNVYTAFDYSEEGDVYDTLAYSVDGALLDALYRRIHRGLVMDDHDRAVARVTGVELLDATVAEPASALTDGRFRVTARWRVDGTVVHWGHAHVRIHEYAATYSIAQTDRGWRIVDQLMLEQQRIPNPADPLEQGVTVTLPLELELEL